jgi:LPS-assembly protein
MRIIVPLITLSLWPTIGAANQKLDSLPVYIEADAMNYDQSKEVVIAAGSVQVTQGARVVLSETLAYYKNTNTVLASGKVSVLEPDGNVYFAESVELKDDLKQGIVQNFRARLSDNSLLAANVARRVDENIAEMEQAVYSPCKLCEEDPSKAPLWQVKADNVRLDNNEQKMYYRNAFLEVYGVPLMYSPYFSHPTPDAKRKSGFLTPTFQASNGNLGYSIETPYYFNLADNMDATLSPMLTSKEGAVMKGEYRHLVRGGYYQFRGSVTRPDERDNLGNEISGEKDVRGHVEGYGDFRMDDNWTWGFSGRRASDDTYLGRYGFGYEDTLTSTAIVEKIKNREYFGARALSFQGLRIDDNPDTTPTVLPVAEYSYESRPLGLGYMQNARWFGGGNLFALNRDIGADSRRASGNVGIRAPYKTAGGQLIELKSFIRGDAYDIENYDPALAGISTPGNGGGSVFGIDSLDENPTRFLPQAELDWQFPLVSGFADSSYSILSPRVQFITAPKGINPLDIANEDSQVLEFSYLNLFSGNRSAGYDLVESGSRVNYGLGGTLFLDGSRYFDYLLGQSYRFEDDDFNRLLGEDQDNLSDLVGRLGVTFETLNVNYFFRLKRDGFVPRQNGVNADLFIKPLTLGVQFDDFDQDFYVGDRSFLTGYSSLQINDNWNLAARANRDLSDGGGMISTGAELNFINECLMFTGGVNRDYTRDRDIEPNTSVIFRVGLKNMDFK